MSRPLHQIARDIAATWPVPSPHAKAYLKAMHYLIGIEDNFAAGNAKRIVRCFLLYSKDWQGPDAERLKAELREIGEQGSTGVAGAESSKPRSAGSIRGFEDSAPATQITAPVVCELCKLPIIDKFVHGHSVWGINATMCPACHYYIGVGFDKKDGALYHRDAAGTWRHLHGTPPPDSENAAPPPSPITGKIPTLARAKRGRLVRVLSPALRRMLKVMWGWTAGIRGKRKAA